MQSNESLEDRIEARGRALIDRGLLLLGDALHARMRPHLEHVYGPEWLTQVHPTRGRFGRRDLSSYAQCLFGRRELSDTRQIFRTALGIPFSKVDRVLTHAVDVRNRFAHPDEPVAVRQVENDIGHLLLLAGTLKLDCVDDLHDIAHEAAALPSRPPAGASISAERIQELEERAERAEQAVAEADRLRAQVASIEADRERAHDEWMRAEDALHAVDAAREDLEAKAESLRQQVAEADASSIRATQLQQQLELAEKQAAEQGERLAKSEKKRAALKKRLEKQSQNAEEAERRAATAESERDDLAGSVAFTRALVEPEHDSTADRLEQLQRVLAKLGDEGAAHHVEEEQEQVLPAPGEPWPYPRGGDVWTLSGAMRTLVTYDGQLSLDEVLPGPVAARLIDSFLTIRPEGGRVWVDEDADATTYVDGVLTYLGRLVDDPEEAVFDDPPLGTPHPGLGPRYSVTSVGVQRVADGTWLASEIGNAQACAVLLRLLAVRPGGGRYRVDSTGAATTFLEGEWVFAGRVRPEEWFPGEIAHR
ncbi:hypothetical protein [Geodermatophilus normandii]|nr:hypothetical protein [Geodermatophilus normandii]